MGKWTSYTDPFGGHHVIELESKERYMLGDEADPDVYQEFVDDMAKLHNADCATYEARIAALEAELTRVKAESLRVVADGPQREAFRCDKVIHDGRYCFVGPRILDDYFPLQISDSITGKYVDKVTHQTLLQPVRLERWEDEG